MNPPSQDDVTLGELGRKLDDLVGKVETLSSNMADRPTWQDVRRVEDSWEDKLTSAVKQREIVIRNLEHRVTAVQGWQMWAGRLVGGTVVGAVITAIFVVKP